MNYPQDPETKATPITLFGAIFFSNVLIVIFLALFIGFILFFFKRIVPAAIPVYCIVSDYPCYLKRKEFREMKRQYIPNRMETN